MNSLSIIQINEALPARLRGVQDILVKSSPKLTLLQREIVVAHQTGVRMKEAEDSQISKLFDALNFLLGIKVDDEDEYNDNLLHLTEWLQLDYAERSIEEFLLAYRLLVRGDLNLEAYPILTPAQIGRVMKAYDAKKANVYRDIHTYVERLLGESIKIPSEEESDEMFFSVLESAYITYAKIKSYEDFGNYLYEELSARKLIDIPPEDKRRMMERAKGDLLDQKQSQIQTSYGSRRKDHEKEKACLIREDEKGLPLIVSRAKRIAVNEFIERTSNDKHKYLKKPQSPAP